MSSSCIFPHVIQRRTPSARRCASRLVLTTCQIAVRPVPHVLGLDDIRISTRWLTSTRSTHVQLYLTPGGTPFLRSQAQQQESVNSGKKNHCVEPLSPSARVHLCGRGLTDVGEGNALSTKCTATSEARSQARRSQVQHDNEGRTTFPERYTVLRNDMITSRCEPVAELYSYRWRFDDWVGVVVQRVENQRSGSPLGTFDTRSEPGSRATAAE